MITLQEQLEIWQDKKDAELEIDNIIDELNEGILNRKIGMTVKDPAIYLIVRIENDREAYINYKIKQIQKAIDKGGE